MYLSWKFVEQA